MRADGKERIIDLTSPNETPEYRSERAEPLAGEVALRRKMEAVAVELSALPDLRASGWTSWPTFDGFGLSTLA